ncbi:MAG: hypothetical protein OXH00_02890 [Candidatus Poribacteria bacterium]|nr:hypothetical protein [Candidatus Poribacteria bacterium]
MAKKHRAHLVFPILPSELQTLQLGKLPEHIEVGGLIFTRYEVEKALRRWQQTKMPSPLKHPSRSAYLKKCQDAQKSADIAVRRIRTAYAKVQEDIEVAKTDILVKITDKQELERELQHEIALRHAADKEKKYAEDLVDAQQNKLTSSEHQNVILQKTLERYEIRYQTLRAEYPLNWLQRFIGWVFRIC